MKDQKDKTEHKNQDAIKSYMKYSGIGIQMAITIGLGVVIGLFLDKRFGFEQNYMTALFSVIFTGIAIFNVVRITLK